METGDKPKDRQQNETGKPIDTTKTGTLRETLYRHGQVPT